MRLPVVSSLLLCVLVLVPGCVSTPPDVFDRVATPRPVSTPSVNQSGFTAEQIRQKSIALYIGQTAVEAAQLLGAPDETASKTYGTQTATPWLGTEWIYRWPHRRLSVVLQGQASNLYVNSWGWYDY